MVSKFRNIYTAHAILFVHTSIDLWRLTLEEEMCKMSYLLCDLIFSHGAVIATAYPFLKECQNTLKQVRCLSVELSVAFK